MIDNLPFNEIFTIAYKDIIITLIVNQLHLADHFSVTYYTLIEIITKGLVGMP